MSFYNDKINNNLIFPISDYEKLDDNGNNKKKLSKINKDLNNILNIEKNKIDTYYNNNYLWDKLKKFSNEYEFIYTSAYINEYKNIANCNPISRSFFKLWEILYDFKFIIPHNINKLKTAHIAEGPGGFIECIYKYLIKNKIQSDNKIYGVTLLSNDRNIPNWKIKKQFIDKFNIILNDKNDYDGDLYNIDNINYFINIVKNKTNIDCCDFITADGGFDFSNSYNSQENDFIVFLICEIYIIINLLKENGNAIVKIYDIYSRNSMKILYILTLFFDEVFIIKPYSSRPANSEKYILCKSFQHNNTIITKYNKILKNIILTKNLNLLDDSLPYKFIKLITNYNQFYTDRQIKYIQKTLNLIKTIENKKDLNDKFFLQDIYTKNKKHAIEWCQYYNIEMK